MRDFSKLFDELSKKRNQRPKEESVKKPNVSFRGLTVKEEERIEACLLKRTSLGGTHVLFSLNPEVKESFLKWCDERGFFVIDNSRLSSWARSMKSERLISRFYGYAGHNELLNTQENYTEERESIEDRIEQYDFLESRAEKITSLEKAYADIKNGSSFFGDYIFEFKESIRISKDKSNVDPYFFYYDKSRNMDERQVGIFCFYLEAICQISAIYSLDPVFEVVDPERPSCMQSIDDNNDKLRALFIVCWGGYFFLSNEFEPLHDIDQMWIHPPKLLLDYKLLDWVYDVNADLAFERVYDWIVKENEKGEDQVEFVIRIYPEDNYASIFYRGVEEWSIPVCALRFSLAAKLRNLPVEVRLVTMLDSDELYYEVEHDYKMIIRT
jgi:hypothetical protein